ncbi:MAG: hypothetical protein JWL94_1460 [Microbacteriaceae bacterium]|jgi:hypothetical protein|nr:hypothetical protein [Microbacteriaceae bacterium]HEV7956221.1 hypothetical protein [Marisediminicola sp.]
MDWFNSEDGRNVSLNVILPFLAILVAGAVAAAIGRGATRRLLTIHDRENRVSAVATLIAAARRASVWNTLSAPEQQHGDHVASEADVRVRLLAVSGAGLAADWAAHEIAAMKKHSVSFSFQAEQSLIEFRERMVAWQARPSRARKLFKGDLELWAYEDSQNANDLVSQQQAWAASQVAAETVSTPVVKPSAKDSAERPSERVHVAPRVVAAPAYASAPQEATSTANAGTAVLVEPRDDHDAARRELRQALANDAPTNEDRADEDVRVDDGSRPASSDETAPVAPGYDAADDDSDGQTKGFSYSPPVTANAVTKRVNPPEYSDDRQY